MKIVEFETAIKEANNKLNDFYYLLGDDCLYEDLCNGVKKGIVFGLSIAYDLTPQTVEQMMDDYANMG